MLEIQFTCYREMLALHFSMRRRCPCAVSLANAKCKHIYFNYAALWYVHAVCTRLHRLACVSGTKVCTLA